MSTCALVPSPRLTPNPHILAAMSSPDRSKKTPYGIRVTQALAAAGLNQTAAARALSAKLKREVPPQTVQYMASIAEESTLSADLAALCGVRYEWLAHGIGPMLEDGGHQGVSAEEFVEVRAMILKGSAGTGYLPDFVEVKGGRAYTRSFFKQQRVDPHNCFRIQVQGRSMERTLFEGDWALVNGGATDIRNNKVYAFAVRDEIRIKRFFWLADGSLLLHSDNDKEYPDETLSERDAETFAVLGQIIDRSGSGGL